MLEYVIMIMNNYIYLVSVRITNAEEHYTVIALGQGTTSRGLTT